MAAAILPRSCIEGVYRGKGGYCRNSFILCGTLF